MLLKLNVSLEQDGKHFSLDKVYEQQSLVIGRSGEADVQIPFSKVSRTHCRIDRVEHGYTVTDLGSTHGTTLQERPLKAGEAAPLLEGDSLSLGGAIVRISLFAPEESTGEIVKQQLAEFFEQTTNSVDPYLTILSGRHKDMHYSLQGASVELVLGRGDECDIVVEDVAASRRHGRVVKDPLQGVAYECLGAKNEALLNGEKIPLRGRVALSDRDVLQIGAVRIMFVSPGAALEKEIESIFALREPPNVVPANVAAPAVASPTVRQTTAASTPETPMDPGSPGEPRPTETEHQLPSATDIIARTDRSSFATGLLIGGVLGLALGAGATAIAFLLS